MAFSDMVPRTKFFIPPARARRVARTRLIEQLRDDLAQPMVLVAAPAGFGKTTLIADWIAADHRRAAWLALDTGDNDPIHFWAAVALALDTIQPGISARTLRLLRAPQLSIATIVPILLNDLTTAPAADAHGRPALLVLDDYHVIENRAIHDTVALLIERLPPSLRLVLASRVDPPLPLPRLRVRGQIAEVRAADLAFTLDEVAAFLGQTMDLSPTSTMVATLAARTEGWVAALQLAALSLRGQPDMAAALAAFSGGHRHLVAYLVDEVLSRQPEHIQTFLLHTSILDRMCAELCDALLEARNVRPGASEPAPDHKPQVSSLTLEELERANLFIIPLDNEGRWYRYHHLFAEMLRLRLRLHDRELELALRRRSYAWYDRAGYPAEAIGQALAACDWEPAARMIEQIADSLWRRSEFGTLEGWLDALPEPIVYSRPRLGLARAIIQSATNRLDTIGPLLDAIGRSLAHEEARGQHASGGVALPVLRARLATIRIHAARVLGDWAQVRALAQQALTELPPDDEWRVLVMVDVSTVAYYSEDLGTAQQLFGAVATLAHQHGNPFFALFGRDWQARCLLDFGRLGETNTLLSQIGDLTELYGAAELPVAAYNQQSYARVRYEQNDLAGAEQALLRSIELARRGQLLEVAGLCHLYLALVRLAQGDGAAALQSIEQADDYCSQTTSFGRSPIAWRRLFVGAWRAHIQATQGDLAAVARWADAIASQVDPASVPLMSRFYRPLLLMQARARMLQGRPEAALALLAAWRARAEAAAYGDALIEILALQALVLDQLRRRDEALHTLAHALRLGAPEGYIRSFADEGAPMATLLRAAHACGIERAYAAKLLAAFSRTEGRGLRTEAKETTHSVLSPQSSALVEPLTGRELEVLRLLAAGHSNRAIAGQLVMALSTVKWYLREIYAKLDVQSRTQAIACARARGLLP